MRISDVLSESNIKVFLQGKSKREIIEELRGLILRDQSAEQQAETCRAMLDREAICSTGIGEGVAIPHARINFAEEIMVGFGLSREPIGFEAIDEKLVRIFFMILCPESRPQLQLRFLARVSSLLHHQELRDGLLACGDASEVYQAFKQYEDLHFG
jgi:mannitol/fructose-specific phosphotransferase system IIA component (Ntr-type)